MRRALLSDPRKFRTKCTEGFCLKGRPLKHPPAKHENQVNVLDEKIPLLSFAVDFVTAYEYQKARGIKIHPGLWKDMRVDIFLVKKEN